MAGVRRGGKGERRASEAREDRTREDRALGRGPSPSRAYFDFPPSLSTACRAGYGNKMITACGTGYVFKLAMVNFP